MWTRVWSNRPTSSALSLWTSKTSISSTISWQEAWCRHIQVPRHSFTRTEMELLRRCSDRASASNSDSSLQASNQLLAVSRAEGWHATAFHRSRQACSEAATEFRSRRRAAMTSLTMSNRIRTLAAEPGNRGKFRHQRSGTSPRGSSPLNLNYLSYQTSWVEWSMSSRCIMRLLCHSLTLANPLLT